MSPEHPISPDLSVVVCTLDRAHLLDHCLSAFHRQTLASERFEVIVVDNGSTDDTTRVVAVHQEGGIDLRFLREQRRGISHARNRGWQEARGRVVAYLDDDAVAAPDWCERILHPFEMRSPSPDGAGGKILPWGDLPEPWWYDERLEIRSWGEVPRRLTEEEARVGFSGANMAFLRDALVRSGGFDPAFGAGEDAVSVGEDTELFNRLSASGGVFWYEPSAVVRHYVSSACLGIRPRMRRWYRNGLCRGFLDAGLDGRGGRVWAWTKVPLYLLCVAPLKLLVSGWRDRTCLVRVLQEASFLFGRARGRSRV